MFLLNSLPLTQHLLALRPKANAAFTQSLHPGIDNVLGLRIPDLRALARRIIKSGNWEAYLQTPGDEFMEHRLLHGIVLGLIPVGDVESYLARVARFVPTINSWSVCDVFHFADRRHFVRHHSDRLWDFLIAYTESQHEYEVRFGVVQLMEHFITAEHILPLLDCLIHIRHEGYYVRMAVAWAVAECYLHYPETTLPLLTDHRFPSWTHNKAIQKIRESRRIDAPTKEMLRCLRRNA